MPPRFILMNGSCIIWKYIFLYICFLHKTKPTRITFKIFQKAILCYTIAHSAAGETGENILPLHSLAVWEVALRHGLSQWSGKHVSQLGPSVPCWHRQIIVVPVSADGPYGLIGPIGATVVLLSSLSSYSGTVLSSDSASMQWVAWPLHWHLEFFVC